MSETEDQQYILEEVPWTIWNSVFHAVVATTTSVITATFLSGMMVFLCVYNGKRILDILTVKAVKIMNSYIEIEPMDSGYIDDDELMGLQN